MQQRQTSGFSSGNSRFGSRTDSRPGARSSFSSRSSFGGDRRSSAGAPSRSRFSGGGSNSGSDRSGGFSSSRFGERSSGFGNSRPSGGASRFGGSARRFPQRPQRGRKVQSFDPSMFVKKAVAEPVQETYVPTHTFADFTFHPKLEQNIINRGYTTLTQIQDQAIPHLIAGKDVIGLANTGTGKTAAFLIPLINKVFLDRTQKVLVVAPTRELATQIEQEMRLFSANMGLGSALCIGGVNIGGQIYRLQRRPHFVIGTPGRLKDLEQQGVLRFEEFNNIVLDEVDQMLDMGFIHDIKYIAAKLPRPRQTLFFSATLPSNVQSVMHEFVQNPVKISVKSRDTSANIDQDVIQLNGRSKIEVLHEMLQQDEFDKVIVFIRTKHGAEKVAHSLDSLRVRVASIHGNKSQNQRQRAIDLFKRSHVQVLIATDVASRGLDIDDVTHVINFDLPETMEDYIHRIGRTGRANKKGIALTFV
jgi:ATP-dependent RNA helicase RhlE